MDSRKLIKTREFDGKVYELINRHVCKTSDIGVFDNLFGGKMLALLDEAGVIFARTKANSGSMVTIYVGDHQFKNPVKTGEQIEIFGRVKEKGNTSITIDLKAEKIVLKTGERKLITSTSMVFVRIDKDGNKKPIEWQ